MQMTAAAAAAQARVMTGGAEMTWKKAWNIRERRSGPSVRRVVEDGVF